MRIVYSRNPDKSVIINTGDVMFTRDYEGQLKILDFYILRTWKARFALILHLKKFKNNAGLSTLIQLGMMVWAIKKNIIPKDRRIWYKWMYRHIWSHVGMAFESLPDEEQVLRIKESVIQGFRRRIFAEHYTWDSDRVMFTRLIPDLTYEEKKTLIKISDELIRINKGYQVPSILAYIPYILSGGRINFFVNTKAFTICYESVYRLLQSVRSKDYPLNSEYVTIFDIFLPEKQKIIF